LTQPWFDRFDQKVALSLLSSARQSIEAARALMAVSNAPKVIVCRQALDQGLEVLDHVAEVLRGP
jgi:hypothetical protein